MQIYDNDQQVIKQNTSDICFSFKDKPHIIYISLKCIKTEMKMLYNYLPLIKHALIYTFISITYQLAGDTICAFELLPSKNHSSCDWNVVNNLSEMESLSANQSIEWKMILPLGRRKCAKTNWSLFFLLENMQMSGFGSTTFHIVKGLLNKTSEEWTWRDSCISVKTLIIIWWNCDIIYDKSP